MKFARTASFAFVSLLLAAIADFHGAQDAQAAERGASSAAAGIRREAMLPSSGPAGRPLPLTASWNIGRFHHPPFKTSEGYTFSRAWGPSDMVRMIEAWHYVFPTFFDPMARPNNDLKPDEVDLIAVQDRFPGRHGGVEGPRADPAGLK
jgi:hypothetical protein